jgi:transposase
MAGKKGQKKRVWSDDEKRSICAQARVAGVSVAQGRAGSLGGANGLG